MRVPIWVEDGNTVVIYLHTDGDVGESGLSQIELHPGQEFEGIPFEQFLDNGSGSIEIPCY